MAPYSVHYFDQRPMGPWANEVHYIWNRVTFQTETKDSMSWCRHTVLINNTSSNHLPFSVFTSVSPKGGNATPLNGITLVVDCSSVENVTEKNKRFSFNRSARPHSRRTHWEKRWAKRRLASTKRVRCCELQISCRTVHLSVTKLWPHWSMFMALNVQMTSLMIQP